MEQLLEKEIKGEMKEYIQQKGVSFEKAKEVDNVSKRDSSVEGGGKEAIKDHSKMSNIISWEACGCINKK